MGQKRPPKPFDAVRLILSDVPGTQILGRIYDGCYPDPLGFGKAPSRFSDPRKLADDKRFGVLYLGKNLKLCFLETVLRDQHDGEIGAPLISETELGCRFYAEVCVTSPLKMVDLRGDGAVIMGVPSDAVRGSEQSLARDWALAFYQHRDRPDGIIYPSRFNGEMDLAIFDRAISGKLRVLRTMSLIDAPGLADVLNTLQVSLI